MSDICIVEEESHLMDHTILAMIEVDLPFLAAPSVRQMLIHNTVPLVMRIEIFKEIDFSQQIQLIGLQCVSIVP